VNDIWKLNVQHYKGANDSVPLSKGGDERHKGADERSKGGDESATTKNNTKTIEPSASEDGRRGRSAPTFGGEGSDLDGELGDSKSPRISGDKKKAYDELIAWSEHERGFKFPKTTIKKQYKAFKLANENDIKRERLIEMWEEMSTDKFWQKTGFDWMNVVQQCLKKPV